MILQRILIASGLLLAAVGAEEFIHPALQELTPIPCQACDYARKNMDTPRATAEPSINKGHLVPLGFSDKGHIAVIHDRVDGGCGHCPALRIQRLKDDKVVDSRLYEDNGQSDLAKIVDLRDATALLHRWHITALSHKKPAAFPLQLNGDSYSGELANGDLWLHSRLKGRKVIARLGYTSAELAYMPQRLKKLGRRPVYVEGYFKDPHADRIAIIVSTISRGFESEIDPLYIVVGARLDVGFRK